MRMSTRSYTRSPPTLKLAFSRFRVGDDGGGHQKRSAWNESREPPTYDEEGIS